MEITSKILIVDDDPYGREALEGLLYTSDYSLLFAENGMMALEMAAHHRPDIILLDVMMPGMNGLDVCRRLRADLHLREVPIILLTALEDRQVRLEGIEAGADDFITKPFDRTELRLRVRNLTRLNRYRHLQEERARVEQAYDETLQGWAMALELREQETAGHCQRVVDLSLQLAKATHYPVKDLIHLRRGALLHDIGKMGIPDNVLLKPGPLTDTEWGIMRQHPILGLQMLRGVEYLRPALDIPHYHHEKWNGSGYPCKLAQEAIPLAARIFTIIDVWDALTNDRVYRRAWPMEQAREYIDAQAGIQFDPALVKIFLQIIP